MRKDHSCLQILCSLGDLESRKEATVYLQLEATPAVSNMVNILVFEHTHQGYKCMCLGDRNLSYKQFIFAAFATTIVLLLVVAKIFLLLKISLGPG